MTNSAPVIWLTGLSGSGKSTIAAALLEFFQSWHVPSDILDGDEIRKTLSSDLGFSPEDRKEHNRRVIFVANLLARNDVTVIIPLISPYRETRDFARSQLPTFVEVYVKTSLETCRQRDPKGLYKKADAGEITNLTGLQAPYEEPIDPEIVVDTEKQTITQCMDNTLQELEKLGYHKKVIGMSRAFN